MGKRTTVLVAGALVAVLVLALAGLAGAAEVPRSDCTIKGTNGDDVLVGTPRADVICGFGGDDTIKGRRGADTLSGGPGRDAIEGDKGADDLFGGGGDDALDAVDELRRNDFSSGGEGLDACVSDPGDREVSCL